MKSRYILVANSDALKMKPKYFNLNPANNVILYDEMNMM